MDCVKPLNTGPGAPPFAFRTQPLHTKRTDNFLHFSQNIP